MSGPTRSRRPSRSVSEMTVGPGPGFHAPSHGRTPRTAGDSTSGLAVAFDRRVDPATLRAMWVRIAAVSGALGVVLGAFGAHGLRDRVDAAQLAVWHTAVTYHLLHSIVLLALGLFAATNRPLGISPWLFAAGIA